MQSIPGGVASFNPAFFGFVPLVLLNMKCNSLEKRLKAHYFLPCKCLVPQTQPGTAPGLSCTTNGIWVSKEMCRNALQFLKICTEFTISWRFIIKTQQGLQMEGIWEMCSKTEIPLLPFSYFRSPKSRQTNKILNIIGYQEGKKEEGRRRKEIIRIFLLNIL